MTDRPSVADRYARAIVRYRRGVILSLLIVTVILGAGLLFLDAEIEMAQFDVQSEEQQAMDYVDEHFHPVDHEVTLVVFRGENVLSTASIDESLQLQEKLRENETVAKTLADDRSTVGVGNVIASATDESLTEDGYSVADKRDVINGHSDEDLIRYLEEGIEIDDVVPGDRPSARTLLPAQYDERVGESEAHIVLLIHDEAVSDEALLNAQVATEAITDSSVTESDSFVFGQELIFERGAQATADSFAIIGPLLVGLIFVVMLLAYRNLLDSVVSFGGIGLVLLWLGGFLGWTGIGMNQLLIAVPCLLVGLSIDHGFHVIMRHREGFKSYGDPEYSMQIGLAGVISAIGLTTATTAIGFLSSVWSPIQILREFGIVAAFGIIAAFVIFGAVVPAIKIELDYTLGYNQNQSASRAPGQLFPSRALRRITNVTTKHAVLIVIIAGLLLMSGGMGLTAVETSTDRTDFLPGSAPAWMDLSHSERSTSEYSLREEALFVENTFDHDDPDSMTILLHGDSTDAAMFTSIAQAEDRAVESPILAERTDGRSIIYSPLTIIQNLANHHDSVADALDQTDTTGDRVPDQDIELVLDAAFSVAPDQIGEVVHRADDGSYESARVVVTVEGDVDPAVVQWEMQDIANVATADTIDVIATGDPIISDNQERMVLVTTFGAFAIALLIILVLVTVVSRVRHHSWLLGPLTIAPVLVSVASLLGLMAIFDIPVNAESAIITGIAIGIGVDYAIHVSERYMLERKTASTASALETTLVETGGTLVLSAVTTIAGFLVLILTFVPSLQRFGILTALFVGIAVMASVILLPALLSLWERLDMAP